MEKRARFVAVGNAGFKQTLTVSATGQATLDETKPLFGERSFVKVFMAGTVPIIISGNFKIDVRIQGDVTGELNATETLTADFPNRLTVSNTLKVNLAAYRSKITSKPSVSPSRASATRKPTCKYLCCPRLNVSFYNSATGRLVSDPGLDAEAGIHGEVLDAITTEGSTAGADYWLSKGLLSAAASAWIMADLKVLDYSLTQWPKNADEG